MKFMNVMFLLLISGYLILGNPVAYAITDEEILQRAMILSDEFRCPTCQGLSIKDSASGFSGQIKSKIIELLKAGKSDQDIRDYFVERYGIWILREPPKSGFNLVLWLLPGTGILIAFLLILRKFRSWSKNSPLDQEDAEPPLTAEEQKILASDLKRFENS